MALVLGIADDDGGSIFLAESPAGESYFNDISVVATGSSGANNNEDPDVLEVTGSTNVMLNWTQGDEGVCCGLPAHLQPWTLHFRGLPA